MKADEPLEEYKLKLKQVKREFPKVFKQLCCPSCDSEIQSADININDKIGKCSSCNVIFPFHEEVASFAAPTEAKQEVLRPEGIDLFYYNDELDITVQQPWGVIQTVMGVFMPFFAVFTTGLYFKGDTDVILMVPIIFTLLAIYSLISVFRQSKSKIYININDQFLDIKWRPKKMVKDKSYPIDEIDQVYVKTDDLSGLCVFMAVKKPEGLKHVKLIPNFDSLSKAKYMEQEIERHLGITNRKMLEENT